MNKLLKMLGMPALVLAALALGSCSSKYPYETVPGDPLQARIYTLDNGLKVYMSVNKDEPRIQTYIAVRVGGKNDPAETTGLAHYFEHLMFKGTTHFGTQNYEAEKPLLDQIEQQFEVYRQTTDEARRKAIYHTIDSLSYEASKLAIPNEYDKLMAAIGANGTNAYTSFDVTCYTEDIPANQVEEWAKIQADRFRNCVIRGFHTELETVYEEKNMSLTQDNRKVWEATLSALFPHHPYGTQTILGTQEHLKNPSITNIKEYYKVWYVPNNMAICLSGDFDPDQMIQTIDKYFGPLQPNPNLPKLDLPKETDITAPIVREVLGPDAENITLAWRLPAASDPDAELMQVVGQILYNGQAGLIDLDLIQQQKTLSAYAYPSLMADYGTFEMAGRPKAGQSLDEVKDLLLGELKKLRDGDFDDALLEATVNNFKLMLQYQLQSNSSRADWFVQSFVNGTDWSNEVSILERASKVTKQQIIDLANKYLRDDNYVAVYKRQGKDPNEKKIDKPQITPIAMNRDTASAFLTQIQAEAAAAAPIEPVFLDYTKDLTQLTAKGGAIPVLYKQNTSDDTFQLVYLFDMGSEQDRYLSLAAQYLEYLGTSDLTPEQVKQEFYRMACSFSVSSGSRRTHVALTGLNEYLPQAMTLFEKLLADAQVNPQAWSNLVADLLKARQDAKLNQSSNFSRLMRYTWYGPEALKLQLTEAELKATDPQQLVDRIHGLGSYKHRILYYGPSTTDELLAIIDKQHQTPGTLQDIPAPAYRVTMRQTPETRIFVAPYDAKNLYMIQYSNKGEKFDPAIEPGRQLYDEYFGGGMNSIVFQEMRESRGLAYSAWAGLNAPGYLDQNYYFVSQIATQIDKLMDAVNTFNEIINNMPLSENAFRLAKDAMITRLRTDRITKMNVIWDYLDAEDLGQTVDSRIKLYNDIQNMTLDDAAAFQLQWVKGRTYYYGILGNKKDLDMEALKKIGPVTELTTQDIFGY